MTSLRQRVGFQAADDDDDGHRVVLDEVEQEEVIEDLRKRNTQTTARALLLLDGVLAFSALLQTVYLLKDDKASPLLALFPAFAPEPEPDPPCPALFALLALALHANLALLLHPNLIVRLNPVPRASAPLPLPLSYTLSLALAAVAPSLSLFLARSWQATVWAALPLFVVALTHSVHSTLQEGDEALAELEAPSVSRTRSIGRMCLISGVLSLQWVAIHIVLDRLSRWPWVDARCFAGNLEYVSHVSASLFLNYYIHWFSLGLCFRWSERGGSRALVCGHLPYHYHPFPEIKLMRANTPRDKEILDEVLLF
ncbi:hypothetical protein MVEN_00388000 [Mycena venus]|uniref:Uncharacterized protein n=1 Tax=Mycena venus TaxID=2733690 RepID=A0A8H6YWJ9_9AGAR|nr:hypothetical protein MVEN_00388000 [Mycena venus]